ncbi:mannosyl-oligosaccharide alpha-1,2-mannosidase-like protein [Lindgomyces ingoldianus]|uniref:Mannosyl-oligosaccharide alpha-1,2-mannosidase-like protein n=1 Tax=Lindgomyces ingoldianus TaxID=673940 RepID=A0ACB6RBP4_9PLEO|nr:mannosyl-oligosaccharide alpha-1,2-mannosidase-like protein [Lindgomyces ingoldianus]KAF2475760.1 mannosyl-oligosaccharide alpha-1,2-mannosidase-like protein [Lindgomyces ingoldianus]
MPGFRRWGKSKFQKNPDSSFKLLAAVLVITLYLIIKEFSHPTVRVATKPVTSGAQIQFSKWQNGTDKADSAKADQIRAAMKYTFWRYRENAWGYDDIMPVSGGNLTTRNGWGAFIVDSATTLALMGLWDELALSVDHILKVDFTMANGPVDPFETTIRYLGGLVSLVDLSDAGIIPQNIINLDARDAILKQAVSLAAALGPAYDTPTGMPWPRVNFTTHEGGPDPPEVYLESPDKPHSKNPVIGPARTGSSILETRTLTRLTGDPIYAANSTKAWAPLVWSKWITPWEGMVDAPIDILHTEPIGRQRHWDGGHDSYYEYLVKITLLAPPWDPYMNDYKRRFIHAAYSLRNYLATRSAPSPYHKMQHLFIGRQDAQWYLNKQGHLACFAPGTILLGSKFYDQKHLRTFALALLEGCHHTYTSTPSKIGPEAWSWVPKFGYDDPVYTPETTRQKSEWSTSGFWSTNAQYRGRPEYVESLFYAWRIMGDLRYREWAWEAWQAMDTYCKAPYGYAQLKDVYRPRAEEWPGDGTARWTDMQESFWAAETLKYLYLTFSDADVASLDRWVFSTEGHVFRMIR